MKRKLMINTNPLVRVYQYNAYANGVLSIDEKSLPWFLNNHIQLVFYKDNIEKNNIIFDFFTGNVFGGIPLLQYEAVNDNYHIKSSQAATIEFIKECINNGYYIYTFVNEFYIPNRLAYNKYDCSHDILIYGYDEDNHLCNTIGYTDKLQFNESEISFDAFYRAFQCDRNICIRIFKLVDNIDSKFNISTVYEMLCDYANSTNCSNKLGLYFDLDTYNKYYFEGRLNCGEVYGLSIYEGLIMYCQVILDNGNKMDMRPFYGNYEHKMCMLQRLDYMEEHNYLSSCNIKDLYTDINKKAKTILNLVIKYNITKDKNIIRKIINLLNNLNANENDVVKKLLYELEIHNSILKLK